MGMGVPRMGCRGGHGVLRARLTMPALGAVMLLLALPVSALDLTGGLREGSFPVIPAPTAQVRPQDPVDRALERVFERTSPYAEVEVVVQFMGKIEPRD